LALTLVATFDVFHRFIYFDPTKYRIKPHPTALAGLILLDWFLIHLWFWGSRVTYEHNRRELLVEYTGFLLRFKNRFSVADISAVEVRFQPLRGEWGLRLVFTNGACRRLPIHRGPAQVGAAWEIADYIAGKLGKPVIRS